MDAHIKAYYIHMAKRKATYERQCRERALAIKVNKLAVLTTRATV